ncbi:hypothetical protein [Alkalimarinus coralli]|uniref:hypothetical protein n=1 Tax=Alkalimarinus coralli TaxID=2935863 RepID=UPI00202B2F55|nr:hypothetical protein [Alkalimarinus coralli]
MSSVVEEKIRPINRQGEDTVIACLVVAVVCCSVLMLWLRQPGQVAAVERVPDGARQTLTELSVAAEEIHMMTELDGRYPTVSDLRQMGVAPFASNHQQRWVEVQPGCYLGSTGEFSFRLMTADATTDISWRAGGNDSQPEQLNKALCTKRLSEDKGLDWQVFSSSQTPHHSRSREHSHL